MTALVSYFKKLFFRPALWTGILVVSVVTSSFMSSSGEMGRGSRDAAGQTQSETGLADGYGFSASLMGLSQPALERRLEAMREAGATWVRYDLSWNAIQSDARAGYDWSTYDRITAAAIAHGFKVVMILNLTPEFARPVGCGSELCGPADTEAYARFAEAAARHYKPYGVRSWEIWNEPNISYRWRPATQPAHYVSMLQASYSAIKRVDSGAVVIAASTAPSATTSTSLRPVDFLEAMYEAGAHGYFDAISAHPYTYPITPAGSTQHDAWGQLIAMHEMMEANGDGDKQIWMTEFGAPTNGPDLPDEYVTEEVQAQIAAEALAIWKEWDWSGPLFWYDYKDGGTGKWTSEHFYGLVRFDDSHKPSYDVFRNAAAGR